MVAYSFRPMFAGAVASLEKCQTVRGDRARHARDRAVPEAVGAGWGLSGGGGVLTWAAGEFEVLASSGLQRVAGWLSDLFALDFRPSLDSDEGGVTGAYGWCLTHRPSGFALWGMVVSLREAMAIADELAAIPGFAELRAPGVGEGPDPQFMKRRCAPVRARLGLRCINPTAMIPPWADGPDIKTELIEVPG